MSSDVRRQYGGKPSGQKSGAGPRGLSIGQPGWFLVVALFAADTLAGDRIGFDLDQARWVNRVLVLSANSSDHPDLLAMTDRISLRACEVANRDLITIVVTNGATARLDGQLLDAGSTRRLLSRLRLPGHEFAMLLFGKDGGLKRRWSDAVPLGEVFALIDGMPMRRAEQPLDDDCG